MRADAPPHQILKDVLNNMIGNIECYNCGEPLIDHTSGECMGTINIDPGEPGDECTPPAPPEIYFECNVCIKKREEDNDD